MRLKPITIRIEEKPNGHIHIEVTIKNRHNESHTSTTIADHTCGQKVRTVMKAVQRILDDYKRGGSLETPNTRDHETID